MNPLHTVSVVVLLIVPFVALFGDIQFQTGGSYGLGSGAFGGLVVAWVVAAPLAVKTARDAGASPMQVWILVVLGLLALLLSGAAAL